MRYGNEIWTGLVVSAILWPLTAAPSAAVPEIEEFTGEVVEVSEGDVIWVMREGKEVEVRLHGIDAPEDGQAFARVSRDGLAHAVFGKEVAVRIVGRDLESRWTGRIYLGDIDVNLELVKAGLAWHCRRMSKEPELAEAQKTARKAKRGLWQRGQRPVSPCEFRRAREEAERSDSEPDSEPGYLTRPGSGR